MQARPYYVLASRTGRGQPWRAEFGTYVQQEAREQKELFVYHGWDDANLRVVTCDGVDAVSCRLGTLNVGLPAHLA